MVEDGIPNFKFAKMSRVKQRIYKILWGYDVYRITGNPSGHSVIQRFEYWKAAVSIISDNPFFGVGTGDLQEAFDKYYIKTNSLLKNEKRLRSHNQFLAIGIALGIPAMLWFIFSLIYPAYYSKRFFSFHYFVFFIIAISSMLTEDTLETQVGVTFYAFFNVLFLFGIEKENDKI